MNEQINLRGLDSLRGLLATYVLAGHARWLLWAGWDVWHNTPHHSIGLALALASASLRYGHEAVMVFFALSGFFIHLNAARVFASSGPAGLTFQPGKFFRRRARRLVPPYAFALLVTVLADQLGQRIYPALYAGRTGDALLDENFLRTGYSFAATLPALAMLPSSLGRTFGSNGPLWSLGYEVIYYLIYPGWLLLRRRGVWLAYGFAVALLGAAPWLGGAGTFPGSVAAHYPVWLAGAVLAELFCFSRLRGHGALLISFLILGTGALVGSSKVTFAPAQTGLYVLGGAGLVLVFAGMPAKLSALSPFRITEWLGVALIHHLHLPLSAPGTRLHDHISALWWRPLSGWTALGGAVAATLGCAAFFLLCERPFLHAARFRHVVSDDDSLKAAPETLPAG